MSGLLTKLTNYLVYSWLVTLHWYISTMLLTVVLLVLPPNWKQWNPALVWKTGQVYFYDILLLVSCDYYGYHCLHSNDHPRIVSVSFDYFGELLIMAFLLSGLVIVWLQMLRPRVLSNLDRLVSTFLLDKETIIWILQ